MNAGTPEQIREAIAAGWPMRVGRKLKRTIYLHHPDSDPEHGPGFCIGMLDSEEAAALTARLWNERER